MTAREKRRGFRLAAALSFVLLVPPWIAAQQKPKIPPVRQWIKLTPEAAATHLIEKVAPTVHRPFKEDGHRIGVETTEDIVLKLSGQQSAFHPPPPPKLTFESFTGSPLHAFQTAAPVADGPPEIRRWLLSQMRRDPFYSLWAKHGAFKSMKFGLPAKMVEIPTGVPTSRIYVITDDVVSPGLDLGAVLCGKNCDIWLVEDDAGTVRDGIKTAGRWFYARRRKGALYPDIFVAFSTPCYMDVYGYVNAAGYWGLLYHGAILGTGQSSIHVLRHWRTPTLAARQMLKILPTRQEIKLPPRVAATHLVKKVAPVYPGFAKAAGIQEVSRVAVVIDPEGRTDGSGPATGWACLRQAAMTAAGQYVYRPFMKDGHPIYVETTENIVFKLPGHHSVFRPPPPPKPDMISFDEFKDANPVADGPPEIRKWFLSQRRKNPDYLHWAKRGAFEGIKDGLPANMVEVPTGVPNSRLYLIVDNVVSPSGGSRVLCSNNGSCDVWVVEDHGGIVRHVLATGGFGFYARRRKESPYPDLFFPWGMSASETDVDGYVNIGGHWGLLYCGTVEGGVHLCRN